MISDRRLRSLRVRLERAIHDCQLDRAMKDGAADFIDAQEALFDLQIDLQREITELKPRAKEDESRERLRVLRLLRWNARRVGDSIAWQLFAHDRRHLDALSRNSRTSIPLTKNEDGTIGTWQAARGLLGRDWGLPLVHDITDCLRVGDITFLNVDRKTMTRVYRTIEVKTARQGATPNDDGTQTLSLEVTIIGNTPFPGMRSMDDVAKPESGGTNSERPALKPWQRDPRTSRQLRRMDTAVALVESGYHEVTVIDGSPHLNIETTVETGHHWKELRAAIRTARRDGYAFFSIGDFVAYSVHYDPQGVNPETITRDQLANDITRLLTPGSKRRTLIINQMPLGDDDHFAVRTLPFPLYKIPESAKRDLIRGRLVLMAYYNPGRVADELEALGFEIIPTSSDPRDYNYTTQLRWPDETTFHIEAPAPWAEIGIAVHEFKGIDHALATARALLELPSRMSPEDFADQM